MCVRNLTYSVRQVHDPLLSCSGNFSA